MLLLRYVEGLGFVELSNRLGITPVATRQRAHRAREELIGACIEHTAQSGSRTCSAIRARLGRYLRGRLNLKTRTEVQNHLDGCKQCSDCLAQLVDLYGPLLTIREPTNEL